ncbi:hypothetical protein FOMPIDRAFT_1030645 [Fomitopsis schrenkii]|uniref:WD40 repeat-like protein n=1 Tax=Fomitopsis schrenkii TaxID=2126942 RepID=S8E4C6_FOMSC|nr:hypothetical protein FOMPIDRAFT_1030645 [Fomitopsis schrenkii]
MEGIMGTDDVASSQVSAWLPPYFNYSKAPTVAWEHSVPEDEQLQYNFARCAKWCPDGSAALFQCENRSFYLPQMYAVYRSTKNDSSHKAQPRVFGQPGPILEFAWYPSASLRNSAAFCFLASIRECPVKLLDASDGRLRASYRIVDHRERHVAPHSIAFNATADRFYCGFEDAIEVFDVQRPGAGTRLNVTPSKKSKDGLKGIISALAFSPDAHSGVFAAGSLSPPAPSSSNIAIFSEATGEAPIMFLGTEKFSRAPSPDIRASVMQLMFNPTQPYMLYASFRRHATIYAWDLRGDVSYPVYAFGEEALGSAMKATSGVDTRTNQKLKFDIDISGSVLGVGDQHGNVALFEAIPMGTDAGATGSVSESEAPSVRSPPVLKYTAHEDAIGSVNFHPLRPLLLSVSGSRHFDRSPPTTFNETGSSIPDSDSSDDGDDHDAGESGAPRRKQAVVRISRKNPQPVAYDCSAKLWDFDSRGVVRGSTIDTAS